MNDPIEAELKRIEHDLERERQLVTNTNRLYLRLGLVAVRVLRQIVVR